MKRIAIIASSLAIIGAPIAVGTATLASADAASSTTTAQTAHPAGKNKIRSHARLNQAVRDGTITTDQKTSFLKELKTLREERKTVLSNTSTTAQRTAERTKLQTELEAWAKANNFPLSKLMPELTH